MVMNTGDGTILYFAYGSCMDNVRLRQHGVDHLFRDIIGVGKLYGYRLAFTRQDGQHAYADIVQDAKYYVEGKVYRLPPPAVAYLDEREGRGRAYDRIWLAVEVKGKTLSPVLSYTVIDKCHPELPPPDHYVEEILRGAAGTVSQRYLNQLKRRLRQQFNLDMKN